MIQEFGGKARFVAENYGDSVLAKRFGVTRYPAIFVDDVLVATPDDFGFYAKPGIAGDGRYDPLKSAASHERFRADLSRMIRLVLAGRKETARAEAAPARAAPARAGGAAAGGAAADGTAALPEVMLTGLDGRSLSSADLAGRVVLVEMWATWCPPCRGTLGWLGDLKKRRGDRLAIVAISVQSEEADVRRLAADLKLPLAWIIGTPEIIRAFGGVSAVPTLLLFGPDGRAATSFYGAPPALHAEAEAAIDALLAGTRGRGR